MMEVRSRLSDTASKQDMMKELRSPVVIVLVVLACFCHGSLWPIAVYVWVVFTIWTAFFIMETKHALTEKYQNEKKKKRTIVLTAHIYKIKQEADVDYDFIHVYCEYMFPGGRKKIFKSRKVVDEGKWNVGDNVSVCVEPGNFDNYEVKLQNEITETPEFYPEK